MLYVIKYLQIRTIHKKMRLIFIILCYLANGIETAIYNVGRQKTSQVKI